MKKLKEIVSCIIIFIASSLVAHAQFIDGTKGLLCMPSAEFEEDATFMITNNFLNHNVIPSWKYHTFGYSFDVSFWGRLEIAYTCVLFNGKWGGDPNSIIFNQDRHFSAKVRILRDGDWGQKWLPDFAVGVIDPVTAGVGGNAGGGGDYIDGNITATGNGYFNRFYAVASKHFDTSLGQVAGHIGYQYSLRPDTKNGVCAAVTWNPRWLNNEEWFMNEFRFTAEWDAQRFNMGINASIWKNRFEMMAMLSDFRYLAFGLRFKLVLQH